MDQVFEQINARFPMKRRKGIGLMVGIESEDRVEIGSGVEEGWVVVGQ